MLTTAALLLTSQSFNARAHLQVCAGLQMATHDSLYRILTFEPRHLQIVSDRSARCHRRRKQLLTVAEREAAQRPSLVIPASEAQGWSFPLENIRAAQQPSAEIEAHIERLAATLQQSSLAIPPGAALDEGEKDCLPEFASGTIINEQ